MQKRLPGTAFTHTQSASSVQVVSEIAKKQGIKLSQPKTASAVVAKTSDTKAAKTSDTLKTDLATLASSTKRALTKELGDLLEELERLAVKAESTITECSAMAQDTMEFETMD